MSQNLADLLGKFNLSLSGILSALTALLICLVVTRIATKLIRRLLAKSKLDERVKKYLLSGIKTTLYLLTSLIVVGSLGIDMTSLVALLSVASLGITLAAEDILANIAGGLVLLSSHPFAIGDYIEASGTAGTVEEINLNHTKLVTPDGLLVMLPNKTLADSQVTNYTSLGRRRVTLTVGVSYESAPEAVQSACREAIRRTPGILQDPAPAVHVTNYGESAVEYTIYCWCAASSFLDVKFTLAEQLQPVFKEHGVEMTYNHLNVHIVTQ